MLFSYQSYKIADSDVLTNGNPSLGWSKEPMNSYDKTAITAPYPMSTHKDSRTSNVYPPQTIRQPLDSGMFSGSYLDPERGQQKPEVSGRSSLDFVPLPVLQDNETTMLNGHHESTMGWPGEQFSSNSVSVRDYRAKVHVFDLQGLTCLCLFVLLIIQFHTKVLPCF